MSRDVLMIGNFLSASGGSHGMCEELSVNLARNGWSVSTVSRKRSRLERLLDMTGAAWRLRRAYKVAQVDVFSGSAFFWAEATCAVLRLARKPYVLTLHGGALPRFARRWPKRVRWLLGRAAAVTTPSQYLFEQMRLYRADMRLIPNALDLKAYEFCPRRNLLPRLVWLRAFHEIYNPTMAIEVVAQLTESYPDVQLTMVGPDKGDGSLQRAQERARKLGVAERVASVGAVRKAEVPAWLQRGDVFLNTTNIDNTPVSVIEAMACGLCVVSTNVGGIPYLLEDGIDALLGPPGNPAAMVQAVRRILSEPVLAEHLSHNARAKAESCDWTIVLPQWEQLLSDVALGRLS